jgi:hypothetical protein
MYLHQLGVPFLVLIAKKYTIDTRTVNTTYNTQKHKFLTLLGVGSFPPPNLLFWVDLTESSQNWWTKTQQSLLLYHKSRKTTTPYDYAKSLHLNFFTKSYGVVAWQFLQYGITDLVRTMLVKRAHCKNHTSNYLIQTLNSVSGAQFWGLARLICCLGAWSACKSTWPQNCAPKARFPQISEKFKFKQFYRTPFLLFTSSFLLSLNARLFPSSSSFLSLNARLFLYLSFFL